MNFTILPASDYNPDIGVIDDPIDRINSLKPGDKIHFMSGDGTTYEATIQEPHQYKKPRPTIRQSIAHYLYKIAVRLNPDLEDQ